MRGDPEPAPGGPGRGVAPLDESVCARWRAYYRGPRELRLKCRGSAIARCVAAIHFGWPFARGQARFIRTLSASAWISKRLRGIPFESSSGVTLRLDIPSPSFLHLSGRLPSEPLEVAIASRLVRPGDLFVDVGAHWGLYIAHVLGRLGDGEYIAIEPSPANAGFLRRTFAEGRGRLRIVEAAICDREGTAYLHREGDSEGYVSADASGGLEVRMTRLDRLLGNVHPDRAVVIKLDVEGQEAAAIRGSSGLAERGIAPIFLLEYLDAMHGQAREDITRSLRAVFGREYVLMAIDQERGSIHELREGESVTGGVRNALAVPPRHLDRLAGLYSSAPRPAGAPRPGSPA